MDLPRLKIGTDWENKMPVYIQDRYLHVLLMGKSGSGKSTSIANWWEQDHYYKNAKVLVDPSGFLARDCYSISGGKFCSQDHPISINPMKAPYTDSQISDIIAEAINQVIAVTTPNLAFTVKMRGILDQAVKYCLKNNRRSLLNVLDYIINQQGDKETRDGIISRLTFILNDKRMEKLFCGNDSVEWGELIAKRQTFILDCFGMSKEKMVFAGSLVAHGINSYFRYSRPAEYLPVLLYIDECHNFINPSLFDILKEGRKYKLSCVLATQDFAVIEERMARVMLNVGNIVSYRLGNREASFIARELDIPSQDIQFMEKYHVVYLTPKGKGMAKAPRPPFFVPKEPPVVVEPQRKAKPSWFTMEPYQAA
jgi:hypothetical protein